MVVQLVAFSVLIPLEDLWIANLHDPMYKFSKTHTSMRAANTYERNLRNLRSPSPLLPPFPRHCSWSSPNGTDLSFAPYRLLGIYYFFSFAQWSSVRAVLTCSLAQVPRVRTPAKLSESLSLPCCLPSLLNLPSYDTGAPGAFFEIRPFFSFFHVLYQQ